MTDQESGANMEKRCPQCGAELPAGGLGGLCPACLLKQGVSEGSASRGYQGFEPPSVTELAKLFPHLEVLALIGRGGMGAVYKARQPLLDRIVALKILPAEVTRGTDFADRFTREARALAKLNHPNIVMVYDFGQVNAQPYFIMEFVDGVTLRQLEQEGRLSPAEALQIVPQICEALQFAHDAGIVHRDIKPDNILVDKRGRVKIADFGIAKIIGAVDPAVPVTQGAIGTPHYMAPEQVEKPQTVDHRADIFSLGVVFYEMLTGELPLGKFAPPSSGPKGLRVDVRLDEVVFRALEREPDRRYQHASQVKTAVETIAGTISSGAFGGPQSGLAPEAAVARDYQLNIRSCLGRSWSLLKANFWPLVGVTALIFVLMSAASSMFASVSPPKGFSVGGVSALAMLLNGPLIGGLYLYFLKKIRREPAPVDVAFSGFSKRFLHLFLANFVVTSLTVLGLVCFVLPGIYLAVVWILTVPLVIDKGLDFWPAMELSRKVVHRHWWKFFFLLLALAAVSLLGVAACFVGLLFAAPLAFGALVYAYEDVFGDPATISPARPASEKTMVIPPEAFGPAGTMVMPNLAAAKSPVGTPPAPPLGTPPPPPPGGFGRPPVAGGAAASPSASGGSGKWIFIIGAICILGVLCLMGIVTLLPSFRHHVGGARVIHRFGVPNIRVDQIEAKEPAPPVPPAFPRNPAYAALVDTIHQELGKSAIHFDDLAVTSTSASNLVINFTGLRKETASGTNTASPALVVSNADGNVSVSRAQGIQVTDPNDPDHTSINIGGFHIGVNEDTTAAGQSIAGSLIGTGNGSGWKFTGTGDLVAVGFSLAHVDLSKVLAPPFLPGMFGHGLPHDALSERLEAAQTISDSSIKDKALTALAADAARAGEVEIVKSALANMADMDGRDQVARDSALALAKTGHRKEAIEIAKGIADTDVRDKALAELAQ